MSSQKKIMVLGGDGFCGWPTSLRLSNEGHDVMIVDNLSRREIDNELQCESLTPISPIETRIKAWEEHSGEKIKFSNLDVARDYNGFRKLIETYHPDTIIHFAEQRAAPYSMKTGFHKRYTVDNNIRCTHNVLCGIVESELDIHLVHLGTTGVYGYGTPGIRIPEGYLDVDMIGESKDTGEQIKVRQNIPYPSNAGSVYHMTKTMDQLMFKYYNKNDQTRITDLHQGIVWGTNTSETALDERLLNRFDYDGDYGTVLNRFLIQAAVGYPITVHGTGGQTRAFINVQDTVNCLSLAVNNPPQKGERVQVRNQVTETHNVDVLAKKISAMTGAKIAYVENPRNEDPENDLFFEKSSFIDLGLNPVTLDDGLLEEIMKTAEKYKDRCDFSKIPCTSKWK